MKVWHFRTMIDADRHQAGEEYEVIECDCDDCKAKMPCLVSQERVRRPESAYLYDI